MRPNAEFVISFDFELAWGNVHMTKWRERQAKGVYKNLRIVLPTMLQEMDDLQIPATWATVGAMVETPDKRDFSHLPQRWRDVVTATLKDAEPESFNGRDVFEMVRAARQQHVIGCHSYSHIPFTYEAMNAAVIDAEIDRFQAAMKPYGLSPDVLVFPENRENHLDVLARRGFKKVRVAADGNYKSRWLYLASSLVSPPPLANETLGEAGVIRHAGSMLFADAAQAWRVPVIMRRFHMGLKRVMREGGVLHLWSHPFNFSESPALRQAFSDLLREVARHRDAGRLKVSLFQ